MQWIITNKKNNNSNNIKINNKIYHWSSRTHVWKLALLSEYICSYLASLYHSSGFVRVKEIMFVFFISLYSVVGVWNYDALLSLQKSKLSQGVDMKLRYEIKYPIILQLHCHLILNFNLLLLLAMLVAVNILVGNIFKVLFFL